VQVTSTNRSTKPQPPLSSLPIVSQSSIAQASIAQASRTVAQGTADPDVHRFSINLHSTSSLSATAGRDGKSH